VAVIKNLFLLYRQPLSQKTLSRNTPQITPSPYRLDFRFGAMDVSGAVRIFPRQKLGDGRTASEPERLRGRRPLLVSREMVEAKFQLKQKDAAIEFGISLTAFKQVCRKLGVDRWPYRRPNRASAAAAGTVKLYHCQQRTQICQR
jgi:hypothetical protein